MFYGYILQSVKTSEYYVGHTEDLERRLMEHRKGLSKYTRHRGPWELVYTRVFETRLAAMRWEQEIKKRKSRKYIERLISGK